ncbi:putative mitochondrial metalloendopeptidase OMA1 [Cercophora samala]|uniref:Mitochondrial metalloendopeptidase OMA1 n=1 Tax=Cercophora samala TaxID=330535 RepID=A0AA40DCU9_9PEZI|nr:putative mitochondrial metalloendopeptidase OMA1 [Cercophora samala]
MFLLRRPPRLRPPSASRILGQLPHSKPTPRSPPLSQSLPSKPQSRRWYSSSNKPPPEEEEIHQRIIPHNRNPYSPSSRQRNPYSYRTYNNDHYLRLQAAEPLRPPSKITTTTIILIATTSGLLFYFANLETVPISNRTRFNVYSPDSPTLQSVARMSYKTLLIELQDQGAHLLSDWDPRTLRVKRVMQRLIPFSGMAGGRDQDWEIFVIDAPNQANAFVLPGGKVFVFSGILNLARSDSALATVLGHEIAHNVAGHFGERLSQDIGKNILLFSLMLLGGVIGIGPLIAGWFGTSVIDVAFGNPMSRLQETEADYIGLMMMSEACFDPREAVGFWGRMEAVARGGGGGGGEVPEWASTHPSNVNRIKKIQEWLPEAMRKREGSDCSTTGSTAEAFRRALETGGFIVMGWYLRYESTLIRISPITGGNGGDTNITKSK